MLSSPSSQLDSPSTSLETTPAKHKARKIISCNPCRVSKQRCDRARPCSNCVKKKAIDKCTWSERSVSTSLAKRSDLETEQLRAEVERLQQLVNVLVNARLEAANSPLTPQASSPRPRLNPSISLTPTLVSAAPAEEDLAARLFNLTISPFSNDSSTNKRTKQVQLIEEVEKLLEEIPINSPKPHSNSASPTSFPFLRQKPPTLGEMMSRMPQLEDVRLSEEYYWNCTSWFFHPIPVYVYQLHKESVDSAYSRNEVADPVSLSIVFAVLGIGLHCRYTYTRSGGSQEELRVARMWIEFAAAALSHSSFLEHPTLDAVRALSLLAIFHLSIGSGDEGTLGFALTGLAVQASLHIDLQRDPAQLNTLVSFREAEERRSLIHHVYLLDGICTASYSRGYILLHARDITAAFPLDLHDHELEIAQGPPERPPEETVLTSLIERFKAFRYSEKVTEELLSGESLSYELVLALDFELEQLSTSVNPLYQWNQLAHLQLNTPEDELRAWRISIVWIILWREKLRLHRPFLARSYADPELAYSRHACVNAAKSLLAIHACPANSIPAAGFTHKASLGCIILALEVVFDSSQPAAQEYRRLIAEALVRLEKFAKISIIARRGVKVIRFLMDKADVASPQLLLSSLPPLPPQKRLRPTSSPIQPHPKTDPILTEGSSSLDSIQKSFDESFTSESSATSSFLDRSSSISSCPTQSPPLFDPSLTEPVSSSILLEQVGLAFPDSSHDTGSISSLFDDSSTTLFNDNTHYTSDVTFGDSSSSQSQAGFDFDPSQLFANDLSDTNYLFDPLSTARCSPLSLSDPNDLEGLSASINPSI